MSLRILLVEKQAPTTELFLPGLQRKGYEVVAVRTLRQALARVGSFRADILIVDAASFGNGGYKITDELRSQLPGIPTILLLEKGHAASAQSAEEFLIKPASPRSLLHRVGKIAATLTSRELSAGPLQLEPDTRCLRRGGRVIYLRPKEAALLAFFMRNPGRVLSREEIIRTVWETDYIGDTRTLSVHIRWLRQKIEADPHRPQHLRTVRGVGYRFEASEEHRQP
jgi:DNA-binding response OmpR family regulator